MTQSGFNLRDNKVFKHKIALNKYAKNRFMQSVLICNEKPELEGVMSRLLQRLRPKSAEGQNKVRIGGANDGGYVMLDPGKNGIAYSFGVSAYSPWDEAMAERGFTVFQYDGTIEHPPKRHEKMHFFQYNVTGSGTPDPGTKNLAQIMGDHGHETENDIILQIDIEGGEWEFFEAISLKQLSQFRQIIVEFHLVLSPRNMPACTAIFEKILQTHEVIHFHYNNSGHITLFDNFCASNYWEISFARKKDYNFTDCHGIYPTELDAPCIPRLDDVYIGCFDFFL